MKSLVSKTIAFVVVITAFCAFKPKPGGEGFEIYLNDKVVIQQFGKDMNTVKSLNLTSNQLTGKLTVRYHHCGRVGNNRVITIKDEANKLLKEFRFADAKKPVANMSVNVKDIINLKKSDKSSLKIYYSSTELPAGRQLVNINSSNNAIAAK